MCWVAQHVHIKQLCNISTAVRVVFLSEGWAYGSTLFLDHLTLLCLGPGCPDGPDQLPQSDRGWHSLWKYKEGKWVSVHDLGGGTRQQVSEKLHFSNQLITKTQPTKSQLNLYFLKFFCTTAKTKTNKWWICKQPHWSTWQHRSWTKIGNVKEYISMSEGTMPGGSPKTACSN